MRTTLGSAAISSNMAWRMASRKVMGAMGYLRAFPRGADFAGADFRAGGLVVGFAGGFVFAAGSSLAGCVSPKWIGAFSREDRKSTRLNSSHQIISYAVFCLKKKKNITHNAVDRVV